MMNLSPSGENTFLGGDERRGKMKILEIRKVRYMREGNP
jgi:hypothetical protein